jgi:hypothetical protein
MIFIIYIFYLFIYFFFEHIVEIRTIEKTIHLLDDSIR